MASGVFGIVRSSQLTAQGRRVATAMVSLCTSSPMCVILSIPVLSVCGSLRADRDQSTIYAVGPAVSL
jgi:hypothetical protein